MNKKTDVASLRLNYLLNELVEEIVLENPIKQFEKWFNEAVDAKVLEPNAMHLATISNNRPHGRIVLLKGFDESGFTFFTNYESNKGKEIAEVPFASLTFFWGAMERQVRIEGQIIKTTPIESDEYFQVRPRGSQIGAWVSHQSSVVNREELEAKQRELEAKYGDDFIPRPSYWGGYRVIPERIEFWQGRPSRLHDRILFTNMSGSWRMERLSP